MTTEKELERQYDALCSTRDYLIDEICRVSPDAQKLSSEEIIVEALQQYLDALEEAGDE